MPEANDVYFPPPDNDDLTGYDAAIAESFPASDPPQQP